MLDSSRIFLSYMGFWRWKSSEHLYLTLNRSLGKYLRFYTQECRDKLDAQNGFICAMKDKSHITIAFLCILYVQNKARVENHLKLCISVFSLSHKHATASTFKIIFIINMAKLIKYLKL